MREEERLTEVVVPHLAESLVSATIGRWLKLPGEYVREYEILCELTTDKVNAEMPSPTEGTLVRVLAGEGATVAVGEPICLIREPKDETAGSAFPQAEPESVRESAAAETKPSERFSPAVLRLAEEHRIDLRRVKGTALGGRISRKDVLAYLAGEAAGGSGGRGLDASRVPAAEAGDRLPAAGASSARSVAADSRQPASAAPEYPARPATAARLKADETIVPASALRRTIASRTLQSVKEIPHAWMAIEVDAGGLVSLREAAKDAFLRKEGAKLTVAPFAIKAIVSALKEFPMLNASWTPEGIALKKDIHLSVAVGTEDAVFAPVIRNADRLTIAGLALGLDDLASRAREGRLTPSEMQGGTFTFNNTGAFGSVLSYPIINYPQAAIVTFEAIVRRPVVVGGHMIAIRPMVNVCLSLDHRVLDGVVCGRFLQRVKSRLEAYGPDSPIY